MKFKMTPEKVMIALFAVVLMGMPIVTVALPKQERSENENRTLADFPTLVNQSKMDKAEDFGDVIDAIKWDYITVRDKPSFMDDVETYYSDHLAGRESWVMTKNRLETLIGKQEINGIYTVDDQMIQVFKEYDPENVADNMAAMNAFVANNPDIECSLMLSPTSQEMNFSKMPSYGGYISQKTFIDDCYKQTSERLSTIDCLSFLSSHKDDYLFYRTDHHWTSLGAYYAYCAAAKTLGYTAYNLSDFNIESASSEFRGTLYSKTLDNGITPDIIDYYHLKNGAPEIKMTVFDGMKETVYDSLYVREYLDVKDKYSSFTGTNAPLITIETNVDNGKNLLLIKDSYAHSLVPFLVNHYSKITMVDMRYINVNLNMFIDVDEYRQALFMFNAVTFAADEDLPTIKLTK